MKKLCAMVIAILIFSLVFVSAGADIDYSMPLPGFGNDEELQALMDRLNSYDSSSFYNPTSDLPTIDEVLKDPGTYSGRVEVCDDLSKLDPDAITDEDVDFGEFKTIILEREAPEKEFTELDSGYPAADYLKDFPDDFKGKDIGKGRVWVRCDLMAQIPEMFRAASFSDADLIIIGENEYFWSSTLSVSDVKNSYEGDMPEFDTLEEMQQFIQAHRPIVTGIKYYPVFSAMDLIDLYETKTFGCLCVDGIYYESKTFASNPEAAGKLSEIENLLYLKEMIDASDAQGALAFMDEIDFTDTSLWKTHMEAGEFSAVGLSVEESVWSMANELKALDPSEENRATYDMIIDSRDLQALISFADFCNYTGFDKSIDEIKSEKEYLPETDDSWLDEALTETVLQLFS